MLRRPVLALADKGGTGQDDRQHGDRIDHIINCAKPTLVERRIAGPLRKLDGHGTCRPIVL